jgi:hypothetical protein
MAKQQTLFFALWITRNGQRLWEGPHLTRQDAQRALDHTMECYGKRVVTQVIKLEE